MEAINEQIINAIEATNATVDQLVQQGNELCDDVDNLRAADERLLDSAQTLRSDVEANKKDIADLRAADEAIRSSLAADKEHISANKEAIASQAKDLAELRAIVADLRAIVEAQAKEIAELRAVAQTNTAPSTTDTPVEPVAQTTDMAALIARIPKPDAVRTRATAQTAAPVEAVVQKDAPAPVVVEAPSKPAPRTQATTNAVETRAYARQYMIENGAKVEQLRDPAAIEATVKSDAFAAWLATR